MHGHIEFDTIEQMAQFLAAFSGTSTAVFRAYHYQGSWRVEFTGGY